MSKKLVQHCRQSLISIMLLSPYMCGCLGIAHRDARTTHELAAESGDDRGESPAAAGVYAQELILAQGTFPANHGSTLASLGPGHLMSCWFAGSREAARDVQIYCSEKIHDSPWSPARVVVKVGESSRGTTNKFIGNPVIFKDRRGIVWLFYEVVKAFGHSASVIDYKVSRDNGRHFSDGAAFAGNLVDFGHLPRNKPLQLSGERILVPVYREFPYKAGYIIMYTSTGGAIENRQILSIPGRDHLQPSITVVETIDGRNEVLAFMRDLNAKNVLMSRYDFKGKAFSSVQKTNLPNPNSAIDVVTTDQNLVLIAYNDTNNGRSPLSLAVSKDGVTFNKIWDFESIPGEYSYPCLIKIGKEYHLTYTYDRKSIKHVSFDQRWLDGQITKNTPAN